MSVSLSKGGNVSLTKAAGGTLSNIQVCLGWSARVTDGADFDLDASALLLKSDNQVVSDKHFVFWGNLDSPDGSTHHNGDNLTGAGDGDDEVIDIDLAKVPTDVEKIVFPVTIYDADVRKQSFGDVENAFVRIVNAADGSELARFDLSEDMGTESCMVFGQVYRDGDGGWKFKAIEQGFAAGLAGLAGAHGVHIG